MAGFDLDTQFSGTISGLGRIETGYADISTGSQTVEVPTRLAKCYFGLGLADYGITEGNGSPPIPTDCSISTASAVTFYRCYGFDNEDLRFRYILIGA